MRRQQRRPVGECTQKSVPGLPATALLLAAATLGLAACSTGNRPAWEKAAVDAPPFSGSRPPAGTTATNAAPRTPASARTSKPVASAPASVERRLLPPPGAAKAGKQTTSTASAPLAAPKALAAAGAAAAAAPLGAPGKPVALAASVAATAAAPPSATAASGTPAQPGMGSKSVPIDPAWTGYETYVTKYEDTLIELAVKHNMGFLELAVANRGVDPWLPGEGTTVVLPNMHLPPDAAPQGLVLNLPEQRLYYYEKGKLVRSYPIGIGRDGHSTPVGSTSIVRKTVNPVWYPTPSARADDPTLPAAMPAGPDNPLGTRAMYLGWGSYLIHGTNKEFGIGRRASRGCIRMYTDDVEELYKKTPIGTRVTVVDQPVKVGWIGDDLYVEASPTMDQVRQWEDKGKFDPAGPGTAKQRVLKAAGSATDRIDWSAFDRAVSERRGIPTRITRPAAPALATATAPKGSSEAVAASSGSGDLVDWLRNRLGLGDGH